MALTYMGSTPTRFQYGDKVKGRVTGIYPSGHQANGPHEDSPTYRLYTAQDVVKGVIVTAANRGAEELHFGNVQVRLDNGDLLWVKAFEIIATSGELNHPLVSITPVTSFQWVCACGAKGAASSQNEAEQDHSQHSHIA